MQRWKRLFYYLLINVLVSACTIFVVLFIWDRLNSPVVATPEPVAQRASATVSLVASATPSTVPSPTPKQNFESYQIRSGDTLGAIATSFGVTIEAIIDVNNLTNPDVLNVGDVLLIPLGSEPEPQTDSTDVPEVSPTARLSPSPVEIGPSSTPLPPGFDPRVEIVTVVGAGNLDDERVMIRLNGENTLSMKDWRLEDGDGNVFIFPDLTLFKGGAVTIFSKTGVDTVVELYWGATESVWEVGETIALLDPQGEVRATYRVP